MKQKRIVLYAYMLMMSGCMRPLPYQVEQAEKSSLKIEEQRYHMGAQTLTLLEKNFFEEAEVVYYAENEMELAKIIQHSFDGGITKVAYQSEEPLDMESVAQILCVVNPFNIVLKQYDVAYKDLNEHTLYTSHHIELQCMDERYETAQRIVKERLSHMDDTLSINEKIQWIHDDIIKHSAYQENIQESIDENAPYFQASGVLLDGRGVCSGYSRAFMMMAQEADIPALYVSSEQMNHGWNYVYDGSSWRYIDVTWDDPLPDQGMIAQDTFLWMSEQDFLNEGSHQLRLEEQEIIKQIAKAFFSF